MPHRGINGGKMKNTADEKVICHICGAETKEFEYLTYYCGGQGNVLRPVCRHKGDCFQRLNKQLLEAEEINA